MRHRLEHGAHVGARALGRLGFEQRRVGIERQAAIERDRFGDVRGTAQLAKRAKRAPVPPACSRIRTRAA